MRKQTAAFFDIGGTLMKGYMYNQFPRYLVETERGLFEPSTQRLITEVVEEYKAGIIPYGETVIEVPRLYAHGMRGQPVRTIMGEAFNFVHGNGTTLLFNYAEDLIRLMGKNVDRTIVISGCPYEPASQLCRILRIDEHHTSTLETENDRFTGTMKRNMVVRESKTATFNDIKDEIESIETVFDAKWPRPIDSTGVVNMTRKK